MTTEATPLDVRLAAVHAQLAASVAELTSSEGWRRMLEVAARFHRYSPNNVLLITIQRPEATLISGYRAWQQLGRNVIRGERGIAIMAPMVGRGTKEPDETQGGDPSRVVHGFRVAHVFDISQTEGKPIPHSQPTLLAGGSPAGLWEMLADQVQAAGFSLDRGECGGANGVTDHLNRTVRVRADVSPAQATKTLAHELAHVMLHGPPEPPALPRPRDVAEVEAESVAHVVTAAAGLPTATYSVPYVAGWSGGDLDVVGESACRVLATARLIIERGGPPPDPLDARSDPLRRSFAPVPERDVALRLPS